MSKKATNKGKRGMKHLASPFISKIFEILETPECQDTSCWNETGDAFLILNSASFASDILPKYFKHNNYSSFVRQLNMYGFHKLKSDKCENCFGHALFLKNNKMNLHKIKRLKIKKESSDEEDDEEIITEKPTKTRSVSQQNKLSLNAPATKDNQQSKELEEIKATLKNLDECMKSLRNQFQAQNEDIKLLHQELIQVREFNDRRFEHLYFLTLSNPNALATNARRPPSTNNFPKTAGLPFIQRSNMSAEEKARLILNLGGRTLNSAPANPNNVSYREAVNITKTNLDENAIGIKRKKKMQKIDTKAPNMMMNNTIERNANNDLAAKFQMESALSQSGATFHISTPQPVENQIGIQINLQNNNTASLQPENMRGMTQVSSMTIFQSQSQNPMIESAESFGFTDDYHPYNRVHMKHEDHDNRSKFIDSEADSTNEFFDLNTSNNPRKYCHDDDF